MSVDCLDQQFAKAHEMANNLLGVIEQKKRSRDDLKFSNLIDLGGFIDQKRIDQLNNGLVSSKTELNNIENKINGIKDELRNIQLIANINENESRVLIQEKKNQLTNLKFRLQNNEQDVSKMRKLAEKMKTARQEFMALSNKNENIDSNNNNNNCKATTKGDLHVHISPNVNGNRNISNRKNEKTVETIELEIEKRNKTATCTKRHFITTEQLGLNCMSKQENEKNKNSNSNSNSNKNSKDRRILVDISCDSENGCNPPPLKKQKMSQMNKSNLESPIKIMKGSHKWIVSKMMLSVPNSNGQSKSVPKMKFSNLSLIQNDTTSVKIVKQQRDKQREKEKDTIGIEINATPKAQNQNKNKNNQKIENRNNKINGNIHGCKYANTINPYRRYDYSNSKHKMPNMSKMSKMNKMNRVNTANGMNKMSGNSNGCNGNNNKCGKTGIIVIDHGDDDKSTKLKSRNNNINNKNSGRWNGKRQGFFKKYDNLSNNGKNTVSKIKVNLKMNMDSKSKLQPKLIKEKSKILKLTEKEKKEFFSEKDFEYLKKQVDQYRANGRETEKEANKAGININRFDLVSQLWFEAWRKDAISISRDNLDAIVYNMLTNEIYDYKTYIECHRRIKQEEKQENSKNYRKYQEKKNKRASNGTGPRYSDRELSIIDEQLTNFVNDKCNGLNGIMRQMIFSKNDVYSIACYQILPQFEKENFKRSQGSIESKLKQRMIELYPHYPIV